MSVRKDTGASPALPPAPGRAVRTLAGPPLREEGGDAVRCPICGADHRRGRRVGVSLHRPRAPEPAARP
jgi:hypothetical protein